MSIVRIVLSPGQAHTDCQLLWSRAFAKEALANYDEELAERINSLLDGLGSTSTSSSIDDLSLWLTFGEGSNMLEKRRDISDIMPMFDKFIGSVQAYYVLVKKGYG
ncbi:hypothetical protein C0991_006330 [Blastosporella zonata]|nr:hypothetical protein C0991_006330 [Blastosporella zonata]